MEENLKQQPTKIIKIAFYGPESTGKSTLTNQLAKYFNTAAVPEFARTYLQEKWNKTQTICTEADLMPIAIGQTKLENEGLKNANKFLFCDTTLLLTKVYSDIYYNFCNPVLAKVAKKHTYDLFFLTDIDVPWEKDDLRDKPNERQAIFDKFESNLTENNKPYILLSGNKNQRLQKAIEIINSLEKAKKMGFSSHDFVQIYSQGISIEIIEKHLEIFKHGINKTKLLKSVKKNDGIIFFSENKYKKLAAFFDANCKNRKIEKFVPASGAASRMFEFLIQFNNHFKDEKFSLKDYIEKYNATELITFFNGIEKFPFFNLVDNHLNSIYKDFKKWNKDKKNTEFIKYLINKENLDFANKPKGVIPFHNYKSHIATPIEEHLNESVHYATSNGISNLHFTILETHQPAFETILYNSKKNIEKLTGAKININFSYQHKTTNTISVDANNIPFRDQESNLVFHPGGHGALIHNLNSLDADIIFIKNVDNVIQNHIELISLYKKGLGGLLIKFQEKNFRFLNQIEKNLIEKSDIPSIISFAQKKLNIRIKENFEKYTFDNKIQYLKEILNRPIRVCGMVKNQGEPGGGPFWVCDNDGDISLQIVESSQIDLKVKTQNEILVNSTYFNPVDIVCGTKDFKGQKFDLINFIDRNSGFIVEKTKEGKYLKAYELPGLWNGAMAKWITVFVEVPLITFNPVKTVNDLLKSAHQNSH